MSNYAVITGDIVSSQKIEPAIRERLFADINDLLNELRKEWISSYETYRGDSLQCAAKMPEHAMRIALMIRAFLRSYIPPLQEALITNEKKQSATRGYFSTEYDIRLSIGIGEAEFLNPDKITSSDGTAFRLSGEGLEILMTGTQRLILQSFNKSFDEQNEPAILLLDALIQKWTQNQAELVLYKLQDKKEEEIAGLLKISQSAVNQRTKTAQWHAIEKLISQFERTVKSWNQ